MTTTPWGESTELRRRKLRGRQRLAPEEVERNQRERLYGATVAVVAEKGYGPTTIADLMTVAGVSRSTFYSYFEDKESCFLATLELLLAGVVVATETALEGEGPLRERAEAGLGAFIGLLVAQPDAARICVVESDAAGERAIAMVDAAAARFASILAEVFERLPEQKGMPRQVVDAMVGGVRKLLQSRLNRRTEDELPKLVPHLVALGLSYRPPPRRLPDRAPRGKNNQPEAGRQRGIDEPAQRIELAAMAVIARDGYSASTVADIAKEAGVSLKTLYATFADKADLFEAALLRSRLRMGAATIPAFRRASNRTAGIVELVRSGLAFLEAEDDFARLITVDVHGAGRAALESRDRALDATRHYIEAGTGEGLDPIATEAIQSALYALLVARVRSRYKNLQGMAPLAIYLILCPTLGAEEAYRYAVS
jgi:AcrR family transcriptional regulator